MHYHRLNDDYLPIHRLCRLFLDGFSLEDQSGAFDLRAFVVDMNSLFERFVAALVTTHRPGDGHAVAQTHRHLDIENAIAIRPDLILRRSGVETLIADTKYKNIDDTRPADADFYQMVSYCLSQNVARGVLVYPTRGGAPDRSFTIRNAQITVHTRFVNLDVPAANFAAMCAEMAARIWALAAPATVNPSVPLPTAEAIYSPA